MNWSEENRQVSGALSRCRGMFFVTALCNDHTP
ncbi:hypothetical protein DesfrDRAFT_2294 [Solidesulfovibrio fructosivorans JJ]]|uniref:Uncharacterized protein n=1 Tax=Solidesulfovibrio fructosivorans JJ] TaxID=596151 RepID=E1JXE5_SOLFR|nr:hypothetical protein DesfrDRAFT_2294 [Solidesulfovibrio fructosivorans JJ]]